MPLVEAKDIDGKINFCLITGEDISNVVQEGTQTDMIHSIDEQIVFASKYMTL